ncbi:MAG: hypothetical protein WD824_08940 [Cyclobacteriaceae bacterium]
MEAYKATYRHWATYRSFGAAIVYSASITDRVFYAEFGLLAIVPDIRFSKEKYLPGFYQLNGLEILLRNKENYGLCLYLGVGPSFINAFADKLEGNPRYGRGLLYINGIRFYF